MITYICTNYNQLSCPISHIRCTKNVCKHNMIELKINLILLLCVYLIEITIIGCMSPCSHNNIHNQLNYNFHYSLQLY